MKTVKTILLILLASIIFISCSKEKTLSDELRTKLESACDEAFQKLNAPGLTAGIWTDSGEELIITRGISNLQTDNPMNPKNHFRIGSITKTFVGTLVLMLADEGKIELDDPIAGYLPELNIPSGDLITVRMLGNMTSGLFNFTFDEKFGAKIDKTKIQGDFSPESLLQYSFRHPLNFAPGSDWEYCNTNTALLGLLIEKITGEKLKEVLTKKIFKPLNLNNTFYPETIFLPPPFSHGYTLDENVLKDASFINTSWGFAAGNLISNIYDLNIWAKALAEGSLLSSEMQKERLKWVETGRQGLSYGFALGNKQGWFGHGGELWGYNTDMYYHPEKKIAIVIHTNTDIEEPATVVRLKFFEIFKSE